MHFSELTEPEQRVLGSLIEKRVTTPDQYPLTLNALRLACNQSTARDPVVSYDEETVRAAADRLCRYGLARMASGHSSRVAKYRHLAEDALGLGAEPLALLCVLLLRGAQTPGELKARSERTARFDSLEAVDAGLSALIDRGYVQRLGRRPGQKEDRFEHLLGGGAVAEQPAPPDTAGHAEPPVGSSRSADPTASSLEARVAALEAAVAELRDQLLG